MCSPAGALRGGRPARSIRLGRKPASVLPPPVGAISRAWAPSRAACTMASWWARGAQPRAANQSAKRSGSSGEGAAAAMPRAIARRAPSRRSPQLVQAVVEAPSRETEPTRGLRTLNELTVIGALAT